MLHFGTSYRVLRIIAILVGVFGLGQQAWAFPNIGYYDMSSGQGVSFQRDSILAAGYTPINVTVPDAAQLAGLDMLVVQNPSNSGYGSEFLANLTDIHAAVFNGMTLMIHDRHVTNYASILPNGGSFTGIRSTYPYDTTFLVSGTELTDGPGGLLDNDSLDNGNSSHHGYVLGTTLPADALPMMSRTNTNEIVTFSYHYGSGLVYYSTIPLDYYLSHPTYRPNFNIYGVNAVAYGVTLTQPGPVATPGSGITSESGSGATFNIKMARQPSANVTVVLVAGDPSEGVLSTSILTFTHLDWNIPQSVTVYGLDDNYADGDVAYNIQATWSSSDPDANGSSDNFIKVVNQDNEPSGFNISGVPFVTSEEGESAEVTVTLTASYLVGTVTVPVSLSDASEASLSTNELVFSNGNLSQTITITGLDDAIADNDVSYQLQLGNAVTDHIEDAAYTGMVFGNYNGTNIDNEPYILKVDTSMTNTALKEGDSTEFTVVLTSQPTTDLSINFDLPNGVQGTVTDSITFTPANWMSPQAVAIDTISDEVDSGLQQFSVIYSIDSTNPDYVQLDIPALDELAFVIEDDDVAGFDISNLTDTSGEKGDDTTFTVALTSEPLANVTVNFSLPNDAEATITDNITFNPANWMSPQTVTVSRFDNPILDERFTISYTVDSTDPTYDGLTITDLDGLILINSEDDNSDPLNPVSGVTTSGGGALNPLLLLAMGWLFAAIRRRETKLQ